MPGLAMPGKNKVRGGNDRGDAPGRRYLWNTPVFKILVCQGGAAVVVSLALLPLATELDIVLPVIAWLAVIGGIAAMSGWGLRLASWWAVVQFVFPFAIAGALWLALPPYVWLVLFVLTLLVYWNSYRQGVPLYLSNKRTWSALDQMLPRKLGLRFIDLGGGIGGTALYLAGRHPEGEFVSVESAPIPWIISWIRKVVSGRSNVRIVYGDIWKQSLEPFDVAYAFLSPQPMAALYQKVKSEMPHGAMFISNSFAVPGQVADDTIELDDRRASRLHVWRF